MGVANTTNLAVFRVWQHLCAPVYFCVWDYEIISVTSTDWAHAASYPQLCPSEVGGAEAECYLWTSQNDRTSWCMKSSKTGSCSERRRPRVSIVLRYSSLQLNSVRGTQCDCCQISGVLQPVELIMFFMAHSRTQSAAIIRCNLFNVGDSANCVLTTFFMR